jgi:phenylacetate-coenzyme A ligase PaaK-like adenylate-forming protein
MPFIRYKTNDVVTLNKSVKYDTPRPLMVTKIDGRVDDMIISDNNAKIPSVNFYTVMSKVEEITMFQLYQKIDKSLNLKIVIKNNFNFSNDLLNLLRSEINKRVGNLPLNFEIVNEIPRDVNTGKIRCVITEIK